MPMAGLVPPTPPPPLISTRAGTAVGMSGADCAGDAGAADACATATLRGTAAAKTSLLNRTVGLRYDVGSARVRRPPDRGPPRSPMRDRSRDRLTPAETQGGSV